MKLLLVLGILVGFSASAQKRYTVRPDSQGHIFIDNKSGLYKAGDTICITGNPKDVLVSNLSGSSDGKIRITNVPGEKLSMGDSTWNGGSYSYGLMFKNCHYIEVYGSTKNNFVITGSKSTAKDPNGYWVAGAYFNLRIDELSDNFSVHDMTVRYGGNGAWCKSEVVANNPKTWWPNVQANFEFYNMVFLYNHTEAMYIGNTSTYWNIRTNQPFYPQNPLDKPTDTLTYKQATKLKNVIIRNNYIHGCRFDGIQTAAVEGLEISGNEVSNWAVDKNGGHNGGILIGGRVKGFNVHDNYVHDGWGEMIQVFAEGGAPGIINYNFFYKNQGEGASFRGTDNLIVEFSNNTVAYTGANNIRINGYFGQKGVNIIKNNILVQPSFTGPFYPKYYIYTENGGTFTEENNIKVMTISDADLTKLIKDNAGKVGHLHFIPEPPAPVKTKLVIIMAGGWQFDLYSDGTCESRKI